ncbi:MAG: hypothetical protein CMK96_03505 [Pseudomonas sp.]|jgi:hypothetical protein|nr:hypothetical protein [Pseudomonas sp.]|tara:strand:- start:532 stop:969 length:438 start_codon:yes stop_codon:yes gene_type:complete
MATPTSLQRLAKRALLTRAKADAGLAALVPAASIAPDGTPSFPFILIASPRTLRLRSACARGATVSFDVHAFAGPRESGGAVVETGEDHIARIGSAIETVFADNRLVLTGGAVCKIEFSDMQLLPDDEPDHWHWISQLNCRVLAE